MLSQLSYTPIFFHTLWNFYDARSLICFQPEVFFIELVFSATLLDWFVFNPKFVDTHLCSFCTHKCSFQVLLGLSALIHFLRYFTHCLMKFRRRFSYLSFHQTTRADLGGEAFAWWAQVLRVTLRFFRLYCVFAFGRLFVNILTPATLRVAWWAQVDSNHRPHAYQACALTTWAMSPYLIYIWIYEPSLSKDIQCNNLRYVFLQYPQN